MSRLIVVICILSFQSLYSQNEHARLRIGAGINYLYNLESLDCLGDTKLQYNKTVSIAWQFAEQSEIEARFSNFYMDRIPEQNENNKIIGREFSFLSLFYKKTLIKTKNHALKSQIGLSYREGDESYKFDQQKYPGAYFLPVYNNAAISVGATYEYLMLKPISIEFDVNYYYNFIDKYKLSYDSRRYDPSMLKYNVQNVMLSLRLVGNINLSRSKNKAGK